MRNSTVMVNSNLSSCGVDQGWGTSHIYLAYDRVGFLSQKKKKKKKKLMA